MKNKTAIRHDELPEQRFISQVLHVQQHDGKNAAHSSKSSAISIA